MLSFIAALLLACVVTHAQVVLISHAKQSGLGQKGDGTLSGIRDAFDAQCNAEKGSYSNYDWHGLFGCSTCNGGGAYSGVDRLNALNLNSNAPSNSYQQFVGGQVIASSQAVLFSSPVDSVSHLTTGSALSTIGERYAFTGLNADGSVGANCQDWSTSHNFVPGIAGSRTVGVPTNTIYSLLTDCDSIISVICVAVVPSGGNGDPHFVGFHGQRFNFDGFDGGIFSLLSTPGLQVNMRINELDINEQLGTWMTAYGFKSHSAEVVVSKAGVLFNDKFVSSGRMASNDTEVVVEVDGNSKLVTVEVYIERSHFVVHFMRSGEGTTYLNIDVEAAVSSDAHGVLGQTISEGFKGVTGTDEDYVVTDGLLGTKTSYGRFSLVAPSGDVRSSEHVSTSLAI